MPASLLELRVLEGANLYFARPAIKLTLDAAGLVELADEACAPLAAAAGLPDGVRPGPPGSAQRVRFAARLLAAVTRRIAEGAGVRRLAVQGRPGPEGRTVVVAYPWRRLDKARALGEAVGAVLDAAAANPAEVLEGAARAVADAPEGERPTTPRPRIPVVAVTGTNGKTTTTRLIAHLARRAGRHVGWTNTDGIYLDGELVEAGDWSGFGGAGRVLDAEGIDLAVLEMARGGILLRGIGAAWNDVAVVTNISADHLGLNGIDTLDQLAEVKASVVRITKPDGWVVLNAEDPRVLAMRRLTKARIWAFALHPDAPGVREVLADGGRAMSVLDGAIVVLARGEAEPLLPVVDVPLTLGGLSRPNLANALAATAAALALGLPRAAVLDGLRTFRPDPAANPGRLNCYDIGGVTVIIDLAHNEDSLRALLEVARGLASGRVRLLLGTAGDRSDELLVGLGEIAAHEADQVVLVEKAGYLRGRDRLELLELLRTGLRRGGLGTPVPDFPTEVEALVAALGEAEPGDVIAVCAHEQREELEKLLRTQGAVAR